MAAKNIYVRVALRDVGFTKDPDSGVMQKMWVGTPVKYSTLTFDQLCANISESLGIPRSTIRAGVSAIAKQIRQLLLNGHTIRLGDLMYLRYSTLSKGTEVAGGATPSAQQYKEAAAAFLEAGGIREMLEEEHILVKPIGRMARALDETNFHVTVVE